MPRRSALASTSAASAASFVGKPKFRKMRVLNSRSTSMGKTWASTLDMFNLFFCFSRDSDELRRQGLSSRFRPKRNQQQTHRECQRSQRHGHTQRAVMLHAGAHQKRDSRAAEARERSGKRKRAGAAFGGILLRQPQRIHRQIRPTKSHNKQTHKEPGNRAEADVEKFPESESYENQHQAKIHAQRAAPSQPLGTPPPA